VDVESSWTYSSCRILVVTTGAQHNGKRSSNVAVCSALSSESSHTEYCCLQFLRELTSVVRYDRQCYWLEGGDKMNNNVLYVIAIHLSRCHCGEY
jgi:hypothetical protein